MKQTGRHAKRVNKAARKKNIRQKRVNKGQLIMASAGPLAVSQRVGDCISRAVEDFARDKKLDSELWYHDEPIWLVRSKRSDPYREVQIAAFLWERDECLFFIPHAYRFKNGLVRAAKQKVVEGLRSRIPLKQLEGRDEEKIKKEVENMLPDAWSKAESIDESDLELIRGRK
jgi:hypothetical protein